MHDHAHIMHNINTCMHDLARFMHERYEFNACSMHDKMQYSCMILAKIHCMICMTLFLGIALHMHFIFISPEKLQRRFAGGGCCNAAPDTTEYNTLPRR